MMQLFVDGAGDIYATGDEHGWVIIGPPALVFVYALLEWMRTPPAAMAALADGGAETLEAARFVLFDFSVHQVAQFVRTNGRTLH